WPGAFHAFARHTFSPQTIEGRTDVRLLNHDQVNELTGKRPRIQRWRDPKADRFPPPVRDGDRKRWPDTEIESYLRWRIAVRDGATKAIRWSEWVAEQAEEAAA